MVHGACVVDAVFVTRGVVERGRDFLLALLGNRKRRNASGCQDDTAIAGLDGQVARRVGGAVVGERAPLIATDADGWVCFAINKRSAVLSIFTSFE